jgi:hypothetical protein
MPERWGLEGNELEFSGDPRLESHPAAIAASGWPLPFPFLRM